VELHHHGMKEWLYIYLLSNNSLINNTSIQKAPGSNLCNRSVKYNSDDLREMLEQHVKADQNRFLPHPCQFITLQPDDINTATRNKTVHNCQI
jgi:hypothetical protein